MAKGQARHASVKRNRASIEKIRETWRKSGGITPRFRLSDLTAWYEGQMSGISSMNEFRNGRFTLDADAIVPREVRERYDHLPETAIIRDREVDIEYDVDESEGEMTGIARLRLPEKLARTLTEDELPVLDRPVRFVVIRGQRGAIRANSLDELQDALDQPWSPDEVVESLGHERQPRRERNRRRDGRSHDKRAHDKRSRDERPRGRKRRFRPR
jgi:hypothetical protein